MAETTDIFHETNEHPKNINIYNQDGTISEEKIIPFLETNEKPRGKDKISKFYTLIKMLLENGYSINENFIKNGEISNNGTIKEQLADAIKNNTHKSERETIFNKIKEETLLLSQSRQKRQEVITPTQETQDKNDEILSETTAVNMRKAFEKIKGIDGYQKLLLIEKILNHYVYENSFLIAKGKNNTCIVMNENGEVQQDYTQTLQQYLNYKDFQKHLSFSIQTSIGEDGYDTQVDNICKKHNISLKYENNKQKMLLISNITNHQKMTPQEKRLLLTAIEGGYQVAQEDVGLLVDGYREAMESTLENPEVQKVTQKAGLQWTAENRDERIRKPEKFIGDVFKNMGPIGLFSIVGLIVGSLFGKKITGEKSHFLMKLLAVGAGIGVYQASGLGNLAADTLNTHGEKLTGAIAWTGGIISGILGGGINVSASFFEQIKYLFDFRDIRLSGRDILKQVSFQELYNLKKEGNLKNSLKYKDGKELTGDIYRKLQEKITGIYNEGKEKYGDEKAFFEAVKNKNIVETMWIVNTKTNNTQDEVERPAGKAHQDKTTTPTGKATDGKAPAEEEEPLTGEDAADLFN